MRAPATCRAFFVALSLPVLPVPPVVAHAPVPERALSTADSLRFEPNVGQADPRAAFAARSPKGPVLVTRTGFEVAGVALDLDGADPRVQMEAGTRLPGVTNYLLGNDRSKWRTGVPAFDGVTLRGVYAGIDATIEASSAGPALGFRVAPGADAAAIRLVFRGAGRIEIDATGGLVGFNGTHGLKQPAPRVFQLENGRRRVVQARYVLVGRRTAALALAEYDATLPLRIEPALDGTDRIVAPSLEYSTYFGGALDDGAGGVAVDDAGNVYLTGSTNGSSKDDPPGALGLADAFVAKFAPDGSLAFRTLIGGSRDDRMGGIAINRTTGAMTVVGETESSDFPTVNAIQSTYFGEQDVFLLSLAADGTTLLYSTYLGGSRADRMGGIAINKTNGAATITGSTLSSNFPSHLPVDSTLGGTSDAFAVTIASNGAIVQATYLGGNGLDAGRDVDIDEQGFAYVGAFTTSDDLKRAPCDQAIVFKFNIADPNQPVIFFKFDLPECIYQLTGIKLGTGGGRARGTTDERIFLTGNTPDDDATLVVLDGTGAVIDQTTWGGSQYDRAETIALDSAGNVYVAGITESTDFPVLQPIQAAFGGGSLDGFVTKLSAAGYDVEYSTYLGGSGNESPNAIAVGTTGAVVVAGGTDSTNFPVTPDAFQPTLAGGADAFYSVLSSTLEPDFALALDSPAVTASPKRTVSVTVRVQRIADFAGAVTVTAPDVKPIKAKITPPSAQTSGDSVTFTLKLKKKAVLGTHTLTFTGRDGQGRERATTLTLTIQAAT